MAEAPVEEQGGDIDVVGALRTRRGPAPGASRSILLKSVEARSAAEVKVSACAPADRFRVACFEAPGHAGFVVSDLTVDENLQLARELAPVLQSHFALKEDG